MKIFITSDTHFGHTNILEYNPTTRPYRDVEHMNEMLIAEWNTKVTSDDLVYHLGDFAFCNPGKATEIVKRLNGRKILIEGNHDHKLLKHSDFIACFEEVHKYHEINVDNVKAVLFHYPIAEWNQCGRGSVMLHGHVHGKPTGLEKWRVRDIGVDATGYVVTEISDIIQQACKSEIKSHGNGKLNVSKTI